MLVLLFHKFSFWINLLWQLQYEKRKSIFFLPYTIIFKIARIIYESVNLDIGGRT